MKKIKAMISILLIMATTLSCSFVSMASENGKTVKQYGKEGGYIAFGDSVARGVGATGDNDAETHDFYDRTVEGSYPYLLAQAVGCNIKDDAKDPDSNFWPVCFHGQTLAMTMDLLGIEDDYYDDIYAHNDQPSDYTYKYYDIMQDIYGDCADKLKQASLVTLGFGFSDIFYRAINVANIKESEVNAAYIKVVLENVKIGYDYVERAYPMLLDYIKKNNPDATVVIVGNYNVSGDTPLSNDFMYPIGINITSILKNFNKNLIKLAEKYGYIYCDITNAETLSTQKDIGLLSGFMDNAGLAGHLSPEGNATVARNIINVLPEEDGSQRAKTKDIVVDLGRFTSVKRVKLNGIILDESSYSMNDYVLSIPNNSIAKTSLVVTAENEEGQTSRYTYQLVYKDGSYHAYLIYGKDNAGKMLSNILDEFFAKIISFFRNLWK